MAWRPDTRAGRGTGEETLVIGLVSDPGRPAEVGKRLIPELPSLLVDGLAQTAAGSSGSTASGHREIGGRVASGAHGILGAWTY
jgi:hypothetical protein